MASKSANQRRHEFRFVKDVNVSVRQKWLRVRVPSPEYNRVSVGVWKWLKRPDLSQQEDKEVDIFVMPPQSPHCVSEELLEGLVEASVCSQIQQVFFGDAHCG